jgi:hypothetical protein
VKRGKPQGDCIGSGTRNDRRHQLHLGKHSFCRLDH